MRRNDRQGSLWLDAARFLVGLFAAAVKDEFGRAWRCRGRRS